MSVRTSFTRSRSVYTRSIPGEHTDRRLPWLSVLTSVILASVFLASTLSVTGCQQPPGSESATGRSAAVAPQRAIYRPSRELGELFQVIQTQPVFEDSKTLVDAIPLQAPAVLLDEYNGLKKQGLFDLQRFVVAHFQMPGTEASAFVTQAGISMEQHLNHHWQYLTRQADESQPYSSLLPLPNAYVVPGGRFREIYYWDSYFTMLGLAASNRWVLLENMLDNFAYLLETYHRIPNGNRSYYLSRSQPPFFAAMVNLWRGEKGDQAALKYLPGLLQEYYFWMAGAEKVSAGNAYQRVVAMPDGRVLNRYFDDLAEPRPESYREDLETAAGFAPAEQPRVYRDIRAAAESGWDFSSRWFADGKTLVSIETTQLVPVDLNSLLYNLELTIAELMKAKGDSAKAGWYQQKAAERKAAINHWLWQSQQRRYGDYHLHKRALTPVASLATVYPLYFRIATPVRAAAVAELLEQKFLQPGGLVTTLNATGEQWDYPNGWAPLQWLAIRGLQHYQQSSLAEDIARRWIALNRHVFEETGSMMEKYNVVDLNLPAGGGEYPLQDGFGWTNGVALAILQSGPDH